MTVDGHEVRRQADAVACNWQNKFHQPSGNPIIFTLLISACRRDNLALFITCNELAAFRRLCLVRVAIASMAIAAPAKG